MTEARIYRPTHRKQRIAFQGKLIGCTDTSFAMLVDATTLGGMKVTETTVRTLSDERYPDPNSPGLNLRQLVDVSNKLRVTFIDRTGHSPTQVRKDLDDERRLVVQLWYAAIGGTNIGHAVHVQCRREENGKWRWLINDPMKTAPQWIDEHTMLEAMKEFAERTGLNTGLRYGASRQVQRIAVGY